MNGRNPEFEMCDHCGEKLNIKHILIECHLYIRERRDMIRHFNTTKMNLTVYNLLRDDQETIEILIKYLRETGLIDHI